MSVVRRCPLRTVHYVEVSLSWKICPLERGIRRRGERFHRNASVIVEDIHSCRLYDSES